MMNPGGLLRRLKRHFKRPDVDAEATSIASPALPDPVDDSNSYDPGFTFFPNAHDFTIGNQTINLRSSKTLYDYLQDHIAIGAAHNSGERCDAPKCHQDTRVAVQEEILGWITHDGDGYGLAKKIMWVTGPAGTGKTAIAGSIADICQERGLLAGSFFFSSSSGSANRRSKRCLVATLAYQIACLSGMSRYASHLALSIEKDPSIFHRRLQDQVSALLLHPLREALGRCDSPCLPKVVVIDAVDEVEADKYHDSARQQARRTSEDDQTEILSILFTLAQDPTFPFRILVCSRPERIIDDFFLTHAQHITAKLFLDFKYGPDADIELYLRAKFTDIRRRYGLSTCWPSQKAIEWIVERASGHFIFAATVMRFVADASDPPQVQLERILNLQLLPESETQNPFGPVDSLYVHIIKSSPKPYLAVKWIRTISEPSDAVQLARPVFIWKLLLETWEGEANYVLNSLASLVSIADDPTPFFRIYHKSLLDFLSDKARCGDLFLETDDLHHYISRRFVALLENKGPLVPFSQEEWKRFLRSFAMAARHFMCFIGPSSIVGLASCDAAWWARTILVGRPHHSGSPQSTAQGPANPRFCRALFPFLVDLHKYTCEGPVCNAACQHWTRHILAELKAYSYCVHDLEELLSSGEGRAATPMWILEAKIRPMSPRSTKYSCALCSSTAVFTSTE